jgi:hypothetical protein
VRIERAAAPKRQREIGKAAARLNQLYGKCMQIQDFKAALAVQREISTLFALYAPEVREHAEDAQTFARNTLAAIEQMKAAQTYAPLE